MPLQTGTWTIVSNGISGQLSVNDVGPSGNMTGTLTFGSYTIPIGGWWDDDSQRLAFAYGANGSTFQGLIVYTGFLFQDPNRFTGVRGPIAYTLAGYFTSGPVNRETAEKHVFGWYAQIGVG
jgi:hypothetical protein